MTATFSNEGLVLSSICQSSSISAQSVKKQPTLKKKLFKKTKKGGVAEDSCTIVLLVAFHWNSDQLCGTVPFVRHQTVRLMRLENMKEAGKLRKTVRTDETKVNFAALSL